MSGVEPGSLDSDAPTGDTVTSASTATTGTATAGTATATPVRVTSVPTPSAPPRLTGPATLTATDVNATVRLHRGQSAHVILAGTGGFAWHVPAATGTVVRRSDAGGGYPTQEPARATFTAIRIGRAVISATDDIGCLHTRPACLPPTRLWQATIIVE
ncbi:hypothetical protein GCM10023317_40240 [Actinopolymorpha pittospori]